MTDALPITSYPYFTGTIARFTGTIIDDEEILFGDVGVIVEAIVRPVSAMVSWAISESTFENKDAPLSLESARLFPENNAGNG